MPVRRPRIVLMDPDRETRAVIQDALEERKFEVFCADDYDDARTMVARLKPAVVITDYVGTPKAGSSESPGITMIRDLHRHYSNLPIIGIPASGGMTAAFKDAGAIWAEDKFYIAQGLADGSRADVKPYADEFIRAVESASKSARGL